MMMSAHKSKRHTGISLSPRFESCSLQMELYRKPELIEKTDSPNPQKKKKEKNPNQDAQKTDDEHKSKSKPKFVPIFSQEGIDRTVVQIPGRHHCQCLASRHKLVANCLRCGRIVCVQEGSGPCFTCNSLVCTKEEREIIRRGDRKSEQLLKKLMPNSDPTNHGLKEIANQLKPASEGLTKAIEQKKQLLEFDRTCEKRTQVIDDEADYFSVDSNQWLTKDQKQVLKKRLDELNQKRNSKQNKITFDFAGRRIVEEKEVVDLYNIDDAAVQKVYYENNGNDWSPDPTATINYRPEYTQVNFNMASKWPPVNENKNRQMRIQDPELQLMSDDGWCLTVHQPYASLLTSGIKRFEGRNWYTPHRGRLWIASANKQPASGDIKTVEACYRMLNQSGTKFPEQYPVGVLLGCVDVIDCVTQEQYQEMYPCGECADPYVFICENAREIKVNFPMQGKAKIYKLDQRIHEAAKKTLEKKLM